MSLVLITFSFLGCNIEGISGASLSDLECPDNYLLVEPNSTYKTNQFCVMKYEAKLMYASDGAGDFSNAFIVSDGNASGTYDYDTDYDTSSELVKYKAVSSATGRPWSNIKRGNNETTDGEGALEACQKLNEQEGVENKYDLITNDEWQAMAREIEAQKSGDTNNWGTDSFGNSILNHGNADTSPGESCDASYEYVETDCDNSGSETKYEEKRTHFLASGEKIWDVAGNVVERLKDNSPASMGSNAYGSQITDSTHTGTFSLSGGLSTTARTVKSLFGPAGDYTSSNSGNYAGIGQFVLGSPTALSLLRGGRAGHEEKSGIFRLNNYGDTTGVSSNAGFRCVYRR
ncbi:MAG: hypothetical protein VX642_05785 [Bdellovibrionota bacterium]|nr:hypothetical protein [Bdellovibrionota bacterium]